MRLYLNKEEPGIEEIFNKRLFRIRASFDTQEGAFILATFVTPFDRPEKLQIADSMLKSITINI